MHIRRDKQHAIVLFETALTAIVFAVLLFAAFDCGRVYYFQSRLQHAVSQSSRFASSGSVLENPDRPGVRMSEEDSIAYMIKTLSGIDGLDTGDITIYATAANGIRSSGAGGPGDQVTVRADWRVPIVAPFLYAIFPGGRYEFSAVTDFRNPEALAGDTPDTEHQPAAGAARS